jgi:hypothetical protein
VFDPFSDPEPKKLSGLFRAKPSGFGWKTERKGSEMPVNCWKNRLTTAHNPKVVGSNPAPATTYIAQNQAFWAIFCVFNGFAYEI